MHRDCIKSIYYFGHYEYLIILILLVNEHRRFFHFCVCVLSQFLSLAFCDFHCRGLSFPELSLFPDVFYFCSYSEWNDFRDFFLRKVIIGVIEKLLIFVHWFLYPVTSLNLFNSSNTCLVKSFGFPIYKSMPSANRDYLVSCFPTWMPFHLFLLPNCSGLHYYVI